MTVYVLINIEIEEGFVHTGPVLQSCISNFSYILSLGS